MEPELAFGLPAAGALVAAALRRHRPAAYAGGVALGVGGVMAVLLIVPGQLSSGLGVSLSVAAPVRALLLTAALALGLVIVVAPPRVDRLALLGAGLAGLAGMAAIAAAPDVALVALTVLLLASGQATLPGSRRFGVRLRGPAFGSALLALGGLLAHSPGAPNLVPRLAAIALVLGLAAVIGAVPYLQLMDPLEAVTASPIAWTAFLGPVLGLAFVAKLAPLLPPSGVPVYGAMMVGLGLINLLWGGLAAWRVESESVAWRYSFLADWGLALVGLGLSVQDGFEAAYLVLASILLVRLPLYLWARPVLLAREKPDTSGFNLLLAAALAGAAPFAGFPVRVLLLRAATQIFWPLGLVLALAMLLWIAHSLRLARSLGRPRGRAAVGVSIALGFSLGLGLVPGVMLAIGRI